MTNQQKWRAVAVTAATMVIGCLLIRHRLFMSFVWMNAVAISHATNKPHSYFSIAVLEGLACLGLIWKCLWRLWSLGHWFISRNRR